MKDLFLAYLGRTLNQPVESLAELLYKKAADNTLTADLNDNALDLLLQLDGERVKGLKPDTKQFFDNGYGKGKSETAGAIEKRLREMFGVDPEGKLQGDSLYSAISAAMADSNEKPDKVKTSTTYLQRERELQQQLAELEEKHTAELDNIRQQATRDNAWQQARTYIWDMVRKDQALNQEAIPDPLLNLFVDQFKAYDYQQEGNDWLPLQEGKRVENAQGYPRMLAELVRERALGTLPKVAQPPVGSAGNTNNAGGRPTATETYKDEGEYLAKRAQESDPAKRLKMDTVWEAQQAGG